MSREIKFRAFDKSRKEFLSAGNILLAINPKRNPETTDFYLDIHREAYKNLYRDRFVIQQYTGLHDKNGKEIYEGDILRVTDDDGCTGQIDTGIGEVVFLEGLWYIDGRVSNSLYDVDKCFYLEVIGNVHENSELLNKE